MRMSAMVTVGMLQDDKKMTLMSANDEQNGDDAKMMKRRTQGKQETQGKPGDYAQPHADWLLAAPTILIILILRCPRLSVHN